MFEARSIRCAVLMFSAVALTAACTPPPRGDVGQPDTADEDVESDTTTADAEADGDSLGPCWSSPESGDMDAGAEDATGDSSGAADGAAVDAGDEPVPLPSNFSYASQYEMRFDSFQLTNDSPGSNANTFLTDFMDQSREYPIVVLLHLRKIDMQEGTAQLRGGAGLKVDKECNPSQSDCKYEWDPEAEENYRDIELDPRTGELRGQLEKLDFVGTNKLSEDNLNRFTLRIHDIEFSDAHLRPVGDTCEVRVEEGIVEGYVTEEEAKEAEVKLSEDGDPIPLSDLLGTDDLNYDSNDDGTDDAWQLTGRFSATETDIVESMPN